MGNIAWLKQKDFFKSQQGIERNNIKHPNQKILVMALDELNSQSPRASILLKDYYSKLEKRPHIGVAQGEIDLTIKNSLNSEGNFTCNYCQRELPSEEVTIDHYKPQMFRGKNYFSNLKLCCVQCNTMKGAIHPARMPQVFSLFLEKVKEGQYTSCLRLLKEARFKFKDLEFVENKLLEKLIVTEIYGREKNGKVTTERYIQRKLESSDQDLVLEMEPA